MSYNAFLLVVGQLTNKTTASFVHEELEITVEKVRGKHWRLSSKVFDGEGFTPDSVKECVSAAGMLKWQSHGAFLKLNPSLHQVTLIHEILAPPGYASFKKLLSIFMEDAIEWRDILNDFSKKHCLHSSL